MIRAFLDENYELLRPDSGKDFVEFAKDLIKSKYDKGKIGVSSYKNHISYLNKFSEFLLMTSKGTHGADNELIYVGEISVQQFLGVEDKLVRKYRDEGLLGHTKIEGKYWYNQKDVADFLERNKHKSFK